jgi:hypothetical protein
MCARSVRAVDAGFEHAATELRQLVEEQDAAVGQAELAGTRNAAAADQRDVRTAVMRRAKRRRVHQTDARRQSPRPNGSS